MVDPALHTGVEFGKANVAGTVLLPARPQPTAKVVHVAGFDSAVVGIHEKTEPGDAVLRAVRGEQLGLPSVPSILAGAAPVSVAHASTRR